MLARLAILIAVLIGAGFPVSAQENQFQSDLRREREHIAEACDGLSLGAIGDCAYTVTTATPFHLGLGSLAPGNGFAFGLAFSERYTPNESWRLSWNGDIVGTPSGSWRGGGYMKIVRTPATSGIVVAPPGADVAPVRIRAREFTVIDVFAQTISLNEISFFGPGQSSVESGRTQFGERQTILGGTGTFPLGDVKGLATLRPSLIGGVAVRLVDIRAAVSDEAPSIEMLYDAAAAPGLNQQEPFVQFVEGMRLRPSVADGRLQFDYLFSAQQFMTSRDTRSSFHRWTVDLRHEIPLYRKVPSSGPPGFNGPNDCAQSLGSADCPPVSLSRNRHGSVTLRLLMIASGTSSGNQVPFYFQPTLGGSDLNGERLLASYDDYRFRAPNLIALQETFEHSVWGPVGVFLQVEHGKVTAEGGDLGFSSLVSSATVGVTLRAGGFPMVNLSFSWGDEGNHIIGAMNTSLLGGAARPPLF